MPLSLEEELEGVRDGRDFGKRRRDLDSDGEHALDLLAASDLELARLLRGRRPQKNTRRWLWTLLLVALAVVVVGFFASSP